MPLPGGAALDLNAVTPKPARWISDMTWLNLVQLSSLSQFSEILNQVARNDRGWKNWFDTDAPEEEIMPDGYTTALDSFKKLLLIRLDMHLNYRLCSRSYYINKSNKFQIMFTYPCNNLFFPYRTLTQP